MTRIETVEQLLDAWRSVAVKIQSDLLGPHVLLDDPVGTFRRYGFVLSTEAEATFRTALP